jgi:acylphosphatase
LERAEDPAAVFQDLWEDSKNQNDVGPIDLYSSDLNAATDKLLEDLDIKPVGPINRGNKKNEISFYGKKQKAHPILLKATVEKDADGNVKVTVTGKSEDAEGLLDEAKDIEKVMDSKDPNNVFDKQFEDLKNQQKETIVFPNVKSMTDAIEKLKQAANSPAIQRKGDKNKLKFAQKRHGKDPVLLSCTVDINPDGTCTAKLDARSDGSVEDINTVVDDLGDALFENAIDELGRDNVQKKTISIQDSNIENALAKLLEQLGPNVTTVTKPTKGANNVKLFDKNQKKHPLLLKVALTKDGDNVVATLSSICDDEEERIEAIESIIDQIEQMNNPAFKQGLGTSSQFISLGQPFHTSESVLLTNPEDDFLISCAKHSFKDNNMVLEFNCKSGDPNSLKLDLAKVVLTDDKIKPLKQTCQKNPADPGAFQTFIELGNIPDGLENLSVTVLAKDISDPSKPKDKRLNVPIEKVDISSSDYIRPSRVNYPAHWDEIGKNLEHTEYFVFSPDDDISVATRKVIQCTPIQAVNPDDKVGEKHTVKCSGRLPPTSAGADPHILMNCNLAKNKDGLIELEAVCRSEDDVNRLKVPRELIERLKLLQDKAKSAAFNEILSRVPKLVKLGAPHKSSRPVPLTAGDADLQVVCTKHTYAGDVVFQYDCKNKDPSVELNHLVVDLTGTVMPGLIFDSFLKTGPLVTDQPATGFMKLKKPLGDFPTGILTSVTKFDYVDIDQETGNKKDSVSIGNANLTELKLYTPDYLADKVVPSFDDDWNKKGANNESKKTVVIGKLPITEGSNRVVLAASLTPVNQQDQNPQFVGILADGTDVLLDVKLSKPDDDLTIELTARSNNSKLRDNLLRDLSELLLTDIDAAERNTDGLGQLQSPEKKKKGKKTQEPTDDDKKKTKKQVLDYRFDVKDLDTQKWLKARFDVIKFDPKSTFKSKVKRTWELDFFGGQFKNMSRKGKIKKTPEPAKLFQLEKTVGDVSRLRLNFFEASHKYELIFESNEQRERFYECASAMRPTLYVWCPNICKPMEVRCRTELTGTFKQLEKGVSTNNSGSCQVNVTSKPYETISIWCGTWNMGGAVPPKDPRILRKYIPTGKHDLYAIAVQESGYAKDKEGFLKYVQSILGGQEYVVLTFLTLWDIHLCVAARKRHFTKITNVQGEQKATGLLSIAGNKGGVGIGLTFNETSILFISSHLAANNSGETPNTETDHTKVRNQNIEEIIGALKLGNKSLDVTGQYHHIFFMGDMNYRVEIPFETALKLAQDGKYNELLEKDQLKKELNAGKILSGFKEADIKFQPTYKLNKGILTYDQTKQRTPSYTDRILWKSLSASTATCLEYKACTSILTSDHLPVSAVFKVNTVRPYASIFAKDDGTCQLVIESIKVSGRENTKENIIKNPTLTFYASFLPNFPTTTGKLSKTTAPEWTAKNIPVIAPSTCNKEYLKLQYLILALRDGSPKDNTDNLVGTSAMPMKVGLDTTQTTSQKIDLLLRGKKVGDIEVTYKYIYAARPKDN